MIFLWLQKLKCLLFHNNWTNIMEDKFVCLYCGYSITNALYNSAYPKQNPLPRGIDWNLL